ncbi:hypothetical protein Q5M85_15315 [Paraclostridium bifermentans]|nr:hypothetical protein [Paraclostridium bifermentans]
MKKRIFLMTALISTMILTGCSNDNIKRKKEEKTTTEESSVDIDVAGKNKR